MTYTPAQGRWDVTAWVRNIIVIGTAGIAQPGDPITFGGTFNVRF